MKRLQLIVLLLNLLLAACSTESIKRTEAIIPDPSAVIGGSSSATLYTTTKEKAWTAIGQLFRVPDEHPYLTKAGFYCRESYSWYGEKTDLKLVLRISKWDGQKPEGEPILVSMPANIKKDIKVEWIYFDISHLKLDSNNTYVAWLSLVGQGNPVNSSIGILEMRPHTSSPPPNSGNRNEWQPNKWTTDYSQGNMVMWDQPNPDQKIEPMTKSSWRQESIGTNTRFTMHFENIP